MQSKPLPIMRNVWAKLAIIAGFILFLIACSPQKRLNRLLRNHPELAKRDTVFSFIHDTIKGSSSEFSFAIDTGNTNISFKDAIFQLPCPEKTEKKYYGVFVKDTLIQTKGRVTVKVWQVGNKLNFNVTERDTVMKIKSPVSIQNVDQSKCKHDPTWYDYTSYVMAVLFLVFVGVLFAIKVPK